MLKRFQIPQFQQQQRAGGLQEQLLQAQIGQVPAQTGLIHARTKQLSQPKQPTGADELNRLRIKILQSMTPEQRQQYLLKPSARGTYDIKTLNEYFYKVTHGKDEKGNVVPKTPSDEDIFALRRMAEDSGYELVSRKRVSKFAKTHKPSAWKIWDWSKAKTIPPEYKKHIYLKKKTGVAPTAPTTSKSPYQEYPDAFLEGGVWKVMRNGKKYRIEG